MSEVMNKMESKKFVSAPWYERLNALVTREVFPDVIHRVLLYGPPGTGKSSWAVDGFGAANVERVTLHKGMGPEDLLWQRDLQNGSTGWILGPAVRAFQRGCALVLDEIDQHSPELRCALNSILDDTRIARLTLPDGTVITPKEGFCVICTSNVDPSKLPQPIQDRLDVILHADKPPTPAMELLDKAARTIVQNHYSRPESASQFNWTGSPISYRAMLTAERLTTKLGRDAAYAVVFGAKAKEVLTSLSANS